MRGVEANLVGCVDCLQAVSFAVVLFGGISFGRLDACARAVIIIGSVLWNISKVADIVEMASTYTRVRSINRGNNYPISLDTYCRPTWQQQGKGCTIKYDCGQ